MPKVLVTGANGFVATHIIKYLVEGNYSVVGTVRSQSKADDILARHPTFSPNLTLVCVPEMSQPGCWDEVIKAHNFDYIFHTATPCSSKFHPKEIVLPAIEGTTEILKATKKFGKNVKRFVYTSSIVAVVDFAKGNWPGKVITEEDWPPQIPIDQIPEGTWLVPYVQSKIYAEKAAWSFIKSESPNFDLVTIQPPLVFGPPIQPLNSISELNESIRTFYLLMRPDLSSKSGLEGENMTCVDVRDVALAHIRAIERPDAGNKRFLVSGGQCSSQMIRDVLREKFPELRNRVPKGETGKWFPEEGMWTADTGLSKKILGLEYRGLEEVIVDTARELLKIEERLGENGSF